MLQGMLFSFHRHICICWQCAANDDVSAATLLRPQPIYVTRQNVMRSLAMSATYQMVDILLQVERLSATALKSLELQATARQRPKN